MLTKSKFGYFHMQALAGAVACQPNHQLSIWPYPFLRALFLIPILQADHHPVNEFLLLSITFDAALLILLRLLLYFL
jgi:hypothetical protein